MAEWFDRTFGAAVGEVQNAIADIRHELLGGWFGRNFEPHPSRQQTDLGWTLSDRSKAAAEPQPAAHEPEREQGIDR